MWIREKIVNSKWIRQKDSEFVLFSRIRWWIESKFKKKIENSLWINEVGSELKVNSKKIWEFKVNSGEKLIWSEFAK